MNDPMTGLYVQVLTAVIGLLVGGIGTFGTFYMKRLGDKLKRKTLVDEVNRYVSWAEQANSFKLMSSEDKKQTVLERIQIFALENEINISQKELELMIERSIQSLNKLERYGLNLMAKRALEAHKNEHPITL